MESINPKLIITRDKESYNNYKDVANCISGIDCAFWIKDVFNPKGFAQENVKYDVVTFNRTAEPLEFKNWENPIVRARHMQYYFAENQFAENVLISDTPYDYLTLYANANRVYTDLVHASIVSLMYGTPVKYWYFDKRCNAFYSMDDLERKDDFLYIKEENLERKKREIVQKAIDSML